MTDMMRLPLPEPDDAHPLDWFPQPTDDHRGVPVGLVEMRLRRHATRRGGVVKLQGGSDTACNRPEPNTTSLTREIVMPVQRTTRRRQFASQPRVYFMRCETCLLVKIGFSWDFRERRKELQRATGHRLRVLGICPGNRRVEARVHALFDAERVAGEWFRCTPALMAYVEEHTTLASGMSHPVRRAL